MPQVRNDEPIDSVVNDLFGFSFQASVIAKLVGGKDSQNHLSVGVSGSWGSGKTSLLNMVRELLEYKKNFDDYKIWRKALSKCNIEKNFGFYRKILIFRKFRTFVRNHEYLCEIPQDIDNVKVIWFDPWFFGSEETVIKAFFYRIAKELMDEDRELAKLFLKLAVVMSSSPNLPESLPVVGNAFKVINYGRNLLNWMSGDDGSIMDFTDIKRKICERLKTNEFTYTDDEEDTKKKTRKRIVIIIDDLDRLQVGEALTMLKVIRLVTEFGVNFVIGYDEETLSATIDKNCGGYGREYIRKMINIPTYMPVPSIEQITEFQKYQLRNIYSIYPITFDSNDSNNSVWAIYVDLVKTIRQSIRTINFINLILPIFSAEMDGNVLLGLLILNEFFPELFKCLININPPFNIDENGINFIDANKITQRTKQNNEAFDKMFEKNVTLKPIAYKLCVLLFGSSRQYANANLKGNLYEMNTFYSNWSVYLNLIPKK